MSSALLTLPAARPDHSPSTRRGWNPERLGLVYGLLGVVCFSLTPPATRAAVAHLDPLFVAAGRALGAAALAALLLGVTRSARPGREHWPGLLAVVGGVVLGFPLLSTWALQRVPATHAAAVLGLLPLATALAGTLRGGERPAALFWVAAVAGAGVVSVFAWSQGGGRWQPADGALIGAVLAAAVGYSEGARLARTFRSWEVICWALVLGAPIAAALVALNAPAAALGQLRHAPATAWLGFGYVTVFSQFLGFFAWYRGLALGGVARVSQWQLMMPFLTIGASALLLGERVTLATAATALLVCATVAIGRRAA